MCQTKQGGNAEPLVVYMTKDIFQLHTALIMKVLPILHLETSHRKHSHYQHSARGKKKKKSYSHFCKLIISPSLKVVIIFYFYKEAKAGICVIPDLVI